MRGGSKLSSFTAYICPSSLCSPYHCVQTGSHRLSTHRNSRFDLLCRSTSTMSEESTRAVRNADWFRSSKKIRAMAPMTEMSDLPFRLLCRRYGADVCYTPMMYAKHFSEHERYRRENFETSSKDHPLVVQFCAHDAESFIAAARLVQEHCEAVDLNLDWNHKKGMSGPYGAHLTNGDSNWEKAIDIVRRASEALTVPVTCKMRLFGSVEETIARVRQMHAAGCALVALHGRTREQKHSLGTWNVSDWDAIAAVAGAVDIPVLANGSVFDCDDVSLCLDRTKAKGVLCAEGLLQNPALFTNTHPPAATVIAEYYALCRDHPVSPTVMRMHFEQLCGRALRRYPKVRGAVTRAYSPKDFEIAVEMLEAAVAADRHHAMDASQTCVGTTAAGARVYAHWVCQPALIPSTADAPSVHQSIQPSADGALNSEARRPTSTAQQTSRTQRERFAGDGDPVARSASVREYIRAHEPSEDLTLEGVPLLTKSAAKKFSAISKNLRLRKRKRVENAQATREQRQGRIKDIEQTHPAGISGDRPRTVVAVKRSTVGLVVGRGGVNIKAIEELSGAVVQIMREPAAAFSPSSEVRAREDAPMVTCAAGDAPASTRAAEGPSVSDTAGREAKRGRHADAMPTEKDPGFTTAEIDPGADSVEVHVYGTDEQRACAEALVRRAATGADLAAATGKRNRGAERQRLRQAMDPGSNAVRIAIDLSMGAQMTAKEIQSLANQVRRAYGANMASKHPAHLYLVGVPADEHVPVVPGAQEPQQGILQRAAPLSVLGAMRRYCAGFDDYVLTRTEKSHLEYFPKDRIVYMSPDSPNVLESVESDTIYIIGGLVDEHVIKGYTLGRATEAQICTARLPIAEVARKRDGPTSVVLSINQVFEILHKYTITRDWAEAMKAHLPARKNYVVDAAATGMATHTADDATMKDNASRTAE
eukprot:m.784128 g.784128  ORF g.784128 m.784128 type:complete len:933 (+) comp23296_c0_seq1:243-3041(+)